MPDVKFDPNEAGGKATYFRMTECIVPRPIAWVSSLDAQGVPNLAPFSFFTGVTSSPPTLLFCCGIDGTDDRRYSFEHYGDGELW